MEVNLSDGAQRQKPTQNYQQKQEPLEMDRKASVIMNAERLSLEVEVKRKRLTKMRKSCCLIL